MWKLVAIVMMFNADGYTSEVHDTNVTFDNQHACEVQAADSPVIQGAKQAAFLMCMEDNNG